MAFVLKADFERYEGYYDEMHYIDITYDYVPYSYYLNTGHWPNTTEVTTYFQASWTEAVAHRMT